MDNSKFCEVIMRIKWNTKIYPDQIRWLIILSSLKVFLWDLLGYRDFSKNIKKKKLLKYGAD